ncbi:tetratricopeptide repeat protein 16 isoform X1 [Camelus ferus]|uniref:Tetratricopeptide repeat protein 16 isoform X1 n=1 Tax=Camelus ferus TaxID=419612 RepID=A0A8B8SX18_CAMFR|nr:tetratricopeptide repeat protein 16 isoform X1 [Camelus ferus]
MLLRGGSGGVAAVSGWWRCLGVSAHSAARRQRVLRDLLWGSGSLCLASGWGGGNLVLAPAVALLRCRNPASSFPEIKGCWPEGAPRMPSCPWVSVYPSCLSTQDPPHPNPLPKPQLYALGWSRVKASRSACAPARSYHQGHQCLEQEDWEVAVLFFSRALHLDSQLGQCLFEQCAFLDALNVFSQASELQPEKSCFRYRCMACLLALRRHHECLSFVTKEPNLCYQDLHSALLLDPKHPQAKVLLKVMVGQAQQARQDAGILAVQGKLQHALQCINCAIENNPLDPSLFVFRGIMYRRLREFDAAVEDFLRALDMMTESQKELVQQAQRQLLLAYNDFAVHCYMQGAYQESVLLLNKALKDEQKEKGLYINRGDCFFQLGNLTFAEADYQQALALSPRDEGANLRMGLLQEKLGFCEQRSRQFQKAESHFSVAIQHNPQKAQYYLYRARSRQLLQNIFGARQDVATVLLLDPKLPKVLPLMASLFPGMSVEEVLGSQVAHLARLLLDRAVESSLQASTPQDIMRQLKEQELEHQKAQALWLSWKLEQPLFETSKEREATRQSLQAKPERPELEAEAPEEKEEEKLELAPSKERSLTDSYVDQTSSGSVWGCRTTSISEMEMSTTGQEYRSTSTTAVTFSNSSLLRTQSSDLGYNREDLSLSHSPRKSKYAQGQSWRPGGTEATQSRRPSKTEAAHVQSQRPSRTEAAQAESQRPSKTEATQGSKQRFRKAKGACGWSWGFRKADATQDQSWGLIQSASKTKTFDDPSWSPCNTEVTQGQGQSQRPSKSKASQSWSPEREPRLQQDQGHRGTEPKSQRYPGPEIEPQP